MCTVTGTTAPTSQETAGQEVVRTRNDAYAHYNEGSGESVAIDISTFGEDVVGNLENPIAESARGMRSGSVARHIANAKSSGDPQSVELTMPTEATFGTGAFDVVGRSMATLTGTLTVSPDGKTFRIDGVVTLRDEPFDFNSDMSRGLGANVMSNGYRFTHPNGRPYQVNYVGGVRVTITGPVP